MYDLIIIGGGIAGYSGAELSADSGYKTLLIDKHRVGGTHVHRGSIPLKYLLDHTGVSYSSVVKHKDLETKSLSKDIYLRLKDKNVTVIKGSARIIGQSYHGYVVQCHHEDYIGKKILIATGSVPFIPTIPGVKKATYSGFVLSSDNVLEINNIPKDLVVIGGSLIGLEIASYFNDLGCHVTIVEKRDKLAKMLDISLSNAIIDSYIQQGISIILNAEVNKIESQKVYYLQKGIEKHINCERALLSIGRIPLDSGLGLETVGVQCHKGIIVDDYGKTTANNIYAAGDVTGSNMYELRGQKESEKCILNMLGHSIQHNVTKIPVELKTKPEILFLGESEESAKKNNIIVRTEFVRRNNVILSGDKSINYESFCKIIVNQANDKIIGIHLFGIKGKELINEFQQLLNTVFSMDVIINIYPNI